MPDLVLPTYVEPTPESDHATPVAAQKEGEEPEEEISEEAKAWNSIAESHCLTEDEKPPAPHLIDRGNVRAVEFQTPKELSPYLVCYSCGFTPLPRRAFAVHVDVQVNEKGEKKSKTVYACTPSCRDVAEKSLSVLKALDGDLSAEK